MKETPASFSQVRKECLPAIEGYLTDFLDKSAQTGFSWNAEMARYQFSSGGKRLRALIPCWVYAALNHSPKDAVPIGVALEMVHNATLVHDDLQDGDTVRRGIPTVWKKYSEAQAINCGDAMFHFGIQILMDTQTEKSRLPSMIARFIRGTTQVIEGQAQEFLLKTEDLPSVSRYLEVIEGKTAALIATSFGLAAQALGQSETFCKKLEKAGFILGLLFQIQDDLLDIYGDKGRDQKATDIAEGKISILIAQLLEDANSEDQKRALDIVRKPRKKTSETEIQEVLNLFEKYQTKSKVITRIVHLKNELDQQNWQKQEPAIHQILLEMGELFLKPIQHLFEDKK